MGGSARSEDARKLAGRRKRTVAESTHHGHKRLPHEMPPHDLERVQLACDKIVDGAYSIHEAYEFGAEEGGHCEPWSGEYHRHAVEVYGQCLTWQYQHDVGELYSDSLDAMSECSVPVEIASDWLVIMSYLREASQSIRGWLKERRSSGSPTGGVHGPRVTARTPSVIRFDKLAALTTPQDVSRLEDAAVSVQNYLHSPTPIVLDGELLRVLRSVASGASVAELAEEYGYSQRSMYRRLKRLWRILGATNRTQGLRKAAADGLLD